MSTIFLSSLIFLLESTHAYPVSFKRSNYNNLNNPNQTPPPRFSFPQNGNTPNPNPNPDVDESLGELFLITFFTFITLFIIFLVSSIVFFIIKRKLRLNDDDLSRQEENQAYLELNSNELELYLQSKEYLQSIPYFRGDLTLSQNLSIQEKGVNAYEFIKDSSLTNNDIIILNKFELDFFKNFECSIMTNYPLLMKNDVYYFESKIYSLPNPEETVISIGFSIKPYPWFRLPGRHAHSISYDSNGYRRYNQPFKFEYDPPFPKFAVGDVIGVGYRVRSGTVFFTRNGKKVNESKIGGHIKNFKIPHQGQIFPIIGANNLSTVHVNLGQRGFVFIEANVKNWGLAPIEGNGPAPPAYNKFNGDILLERSEIDDDNNDLSDRENDFPPDFWDVHNDEMGNNNEGKFIGSDNDDIIDQDKFSYNAYSDINSNDERITLHSIAVTRPERPPSYNSDQEEEEEDSNDITTSTAGDVTAVTAVENFIEEDNDHEDNLDTEEILDASSDIEDDHTVHQHDDNNDDN
ncbi:hypothetical protein DFJ63DRAFT_284322 [Scheffersomyces coipomensis]|uniref:uncharacterized protein n=1 Tax=Scheffersomyces coipomensis TaxID=1788519 RepID=UPI00315CAAB3